MVKRIFLLLAGIVFVKYGVLVQAHDSGIVTDASNKAIKISSGQCIFFGDNNELSNCYLIDSASNTSDVIDDDIADVLSDSLDVQKLSSLSADTLFDTDSAELSPQGKVSLDQFIYVATSSTGLVMNKIRVTGHADNRGSLSYNQALSEQRALTVANYLGANGIDVSLIESIGVGETQPVASNDSAKGLSLNRRVEIEVFGRMASQ